MNTERLATLEGLVAPDVGEALARLASVVPADEAIVELGSYKGKSTCYLAAGSKDGFGAKVFAVDPWDTPGNVTGRFGFAEPSTRERFNEQIRSMRFASRVTALQGFSADVAKQWNGPWVGLLFIDGDHAESSVRTDFEAWKPNLRDGAFVVFDDYLSPRNPGVKKAVDSLDLDNFRVEADWLAVGTFRG
jgi:predicted O-methyltransferase YrrM